MPHPVDRNTTYVPGLDGVRALAVLAVLGFHFGVPHLDGGLLGVSMFFTLSGYLITGILLATWDRTGGLELKTFWLRRARRLFPALVLVLITVLAVTAVVDAPALGTRLRESLAAAFYVSNWTTILGGVSYFDYFAGPQPLEHLWSLAIEEQFYLLWPLVLLLMLRLGANRRQLAGVTLLLAAVSFGVMGLLAHPGFDHTRAYEGTDARAGELLIGAALAMLYRPGLITRPVPLPRRLGVDLAGIAALALMAAMVVNTTYYSMFLYRGGILLLALAVAVLVAVVSFPGSWVGKLLGIAPMRWLGERSYGIYLWHMPVVAFSPQSRVGAYSVRLALLHVGLTLVLASLSWWLVEDPIRRYGLVEALRRARPAFHPRLPALARMPVAVGAAVLIVFSFAMLAATSTVTSSSADQAVGLAANLDKPPLPDPPPPSATHTPAGENQQGQNQPAHVQHSGPPETQRWHTSCKSVVHVGDSTSVGLMDPAYLPDKRDWVDAQYRLVGVRSAKTDIRGARSIVETYKGQPNAETATEERMDNGYDGCWVFAMGTNDTANQSVGGVVSLEDRIARLMDQVDGQPAMWLTVKTRLSSGPWAEENMEKWNDALLKACHKYPNLRIYDWASQAKNSWYIFDGIHFTTEGYRERARRTARALAVAFPYGAAPSSTCLVTPTSS